MVEFAEANKTREAVDEMGLKPGMHAVATVKATNVMLELQG